MQKFLKNSRNKKGFIAILACALMSVLILASNMYMRKAKIEAQKIADKYQFVECFMTGATLGTSEAKGKVYLHINDNSANDSFNISTPPTFTKNDNKITIHTDNRAYMTLKVTANIKEESKITLTNIINNTKNNTGWDDYYTGIYLPSSREYLRKGRTLTQTIYGTEQQLSLRVDGDTGMCRDKLSFITENVKIDKAEITGQQLFFGNSTANTEGCREDPNNLEDGTDVCFIFPSDQTVNLYFDDCENMSKFKVVDVYSRKAFITDGSGSYEYSGDTSYKIDNELTLKNKATGLVCQIKNDDERKDGYVRIKNLDTLTIDHGITVDYYKDDHTKSDGKISFYGGGCTLTLTLSPTETEPKTGYLHYTDKEGHPQKLIIPKGETQTIIVTPSTHQYKPDYDGRGYTVTLELEDLSCSRKDFDCPQVFYVR